MPNIGAISYLCGTIAFFALSFMLGFSNYRHGGLRAPLLASILTFSWALAAFSFSIDLHNFYPIVDILELLQKSAWFAYLLQTIAIKPRKAYLISSAIFSFTVLIDKSWGQLIYWPEVGVKLTIGSHLILAIASLAIIESLCRGGTDEKNNKVKYLALGLGVMFAYDFYLYAKALLFNQLSLADWQARGAIYTIIMPLLAMALVKHKAIELNFKISRNFVLQSTTVIGAGIYLLAMSLVGFLIREYGSTWGVVAQTIFLTGALVLLSILVFSHQVRAAIKSYLNNNFYKYRYDYRSEWLRFTDLITCDTGKGKIAKNVIKAIAALIDSPGGVLFVTTKDDSYKSISSYNMTEVKVYNESHDKHLIRLLKNYKSIILVKDLKKYLQQNDVQEHWLYNISWAYSIVPLIQGNNFVGFIALKKSVVKFSIDWEVKQLLQTASSQAASFILHEQAVSKLADAKQFVKFNQISAFVMHDIKNIATQLKLVTDNAIEHKTNPEFIDDAFETIGKTVEKINNLMATLSSKNFTQKKEIININLLLDDILDSLGSSEPKPKVITDNNMRGQIYASRTEVYRALSNLIKNAIDATAKDGTVLITTIASGSKLKIEITDDGCGMTPDFIQNKLFKAFVSTKGAKGYGIGLYETKQVINALGGTIEVASQVGKGTTFFVILPLYMKTKINETACL